MNPITPRIEINQPLPHNQLAEISLIENLLFHRFWVAVSVAGD